MHLLLVEDEIDLAVAVQKALRSQKYVVDWAQDGREAWEYLQQPIYTMAILDWMVPGISGLELCQRLRQQGQALPVLILTARDRVADRVAGLDAGADDYLVKPFGMEELLARIRALLRRPSAMAAPVLAVGGMCLNAQLGSVTINEAPPIALTAKEFQLLDYFLRHPRQILTHDQIRARLWTLSDESVSNVVAAQIRLLRRKLDERGCGHWIETVRGLGYRLNPHPESASP
jgi:DNA-binding response OmpR family regulator